MTIQSSVVPKGGDGEDGNEDYPLLVLQASPEVLVVMLDDIRHELGADVIEFLRHSQVLPQMVAVLLECKAAGHTPNLMEAVALAGVEKEVAALTRAKHPMSFSLNDLDSIIAHAAPALNDKASKILLGEKTPLELLSSGP